MRTCPCLIFSFLLTLSPTLSFPLCRQLCRQCPARKADSNSAALRRAPVPHALPGMLKSKLKLTTSRRDYRCDDDESLCRKSFSRSIKEEDPAAPGTHRNHWPWLCWTASRAAFQRTEVCRYRL